MSNLKINQLTAAPLPLAPTDLFVIADAPNGIAQNITFQDLQIQILGGSLSGIAVYYVDGNNSNAGDGSITNPFQTLTQAYNAVLGTGTPQNPQFQNVAISVAAFNYTTNINIWLNNVTWIFAFGAIVNYTGVDYFIDSSTPSTAVAGEFSIRGGLVFKTSTGGFVKNESSSAAILVNKNMFIEFYSAYSETPIVVNPEEKPLILLRKLTAVNSWGAPVLKIRFGGTISSSQQHCIYQDGSWFELDGINTGNISYGITEAGSIQGVLDGRNFKYINTDTGNLREYVGSFILKDCIFSSVENHVMIDVDGNVSFAGLENIALRDPGILLNHSDHFMEIKDVTKNGSGGSTKTKFFIKDFHIYTSIFNAPDIITYSGTAPTFDLLDMNNCFFPRNYKVASTINIGKTSYINSQMCDYNIINGYLNISNVPTYADNTAASASGLSVGSVYRETTTDYLKIVH